MRFYLVLTLWLLATLAGCGTSKWTDSRRSATEQLLVTDAMDRAVSQLDFRALAGKTVYLNDEAIRDLADHPYLASCVRQHLLASGSIVKSGREEADYILEIRAGAIGTDRHELLYGVPAVNIPTIVPVSGFGIPPQIPEIPFVKKTDQRAVAKIALFAYNRTTGRPIWQSGNMPAESDAKAIWVFGAGPFQRGSIYDGMSFAGDQLKIPLVDFGADRTADAVSVADEAYFVEPGDDPVEGLAHTDADTKPSEPSPPDLAPPESAAANPSTAGADAPAEAALPVVQAGHEEGAESPVPKSSGAETPGPKPPAVESPPDAAAPAIDPTPKNAPPAVAPETGLPMLQLEFLREAFSTGDFVPSTSPLPPPDARYATPPSSQQP
jgi:hypothetical protein